ncbi:MAG: ABC transporter substrate-binding protein [Proteobacteria bacterium]|nr:ABC transporter substrate-binding protein [Pseudomonadota bacterium]
MLSTVPSRSFISRSKALVLVASLEIGGFMPQSAAAPVYQYIVTETGQPASLDPLDADSSDNLPVARMIYLTPLEVSSDDRLTSSILEKFSYDSASRTTTWIVRDGLQFSDGTLITADDVAFAVTRMALKRPNFPVIKEIVGLEAWTKMARPLASYPQGIRLEGRTISITFAERIDHPLFRFCLEIFSIIPRRSVDQETGKILYAAPPTSGYYSISHRDSDSITFVKRPAFPTVDGKKVPETIRFTYRKPRDLLAVMPGAIDNYTVASTSEVMFKPGELNQLTKLYEQRDLPKAKFRALLINPETQPFRQKACRQQFAALFRQSYAKAMGSAEILEGSISPRIVTGYLPLHQLELQSPSSAAQQCFTSLAKHPLRWVKKNGPDTVFEQALMDTLRQIGQHDAGPVVTDTLDAADNTFIGGHAPISFFGSGLWALDPFGDLQMLFTPDLHKPLAHLQRDRVLQDMIAKLRTEVPPVERVQLATKLNSYLFEEAILNVFVHSRRFYLSKKGSPFRSLQASITSPTPWQVFEK